MERQPVYRTETLNPQLVTVEEGHMFYDKCIVSGDGQQPVFIKAFNETLFTKPEAAAHTLDHLRREGEVYQALTAVNYFYLPEKVHYDDEKAVLYLSAHTTEDGWHWNLPENEALQDQYVNDILHALQALETIPAIVLPPSLRQESIDELFERGFMQLADPEIRQLALAKLQQFTPDFHPHVVPGIAKLERLLTQDFDAIFEKVASYRGVERPVVGHFDARQSNIAWHPDHGARLVDWSWASPTHQASDTTMFVIDLFKSGYDVTKLPPEFLDNNHALLQIGHWLARSTNPTPQKDETVRFHQAASAVSAATLVL